MRSNYASNLLKHCQYGPSTALNGCKLVQSNFSIDQAHDCDRNKKINANRAYHQ
jgi:hypothetical protein